MIAVRLSAVRSGGRGDTQQPPHPRTGAQIQVSSSLRSARVMRPSNSASRAHSARRRVCRLARVRAFAAQPPVGTDS